MKVSFLEDPACSWCWAFQPVETAFLFEYGHAIEPRRVMGGLRDRPLPDPGFAVRHWKVAQEVSGMPFDASIWDKHILQSTHVACRVVKAASSVQPELEGRLLRRLREAFYVECTPIDDLDIVFGLASEVGFDIDKLRLAVVGGRAESAFRIDQRLAMQSGFGFPTIVIRPTGTPASEAIQLRGLVSYGELISTMAEAGFSLRRRRRFLGRPEDWERLFKLRPRLAAAELETVTGTNAEELSELVRKERLVPDGVFFAAGPNLLDSGVPLQLAEAGS